MKNIGNIIKTLQNIMRKDPGVSGDAQRIEQLGWMISLKILDDKDQELELLNEDYKSPIPSTIQWRSSELLKSISFSLLTTWRMMVPFFI